MNGSETGQHLGTDYGGGDDDFDFPSCQHVGEFLLGNALLASFPEHRDLVCEAAELIYARSNDTIVPREHQLEAIVTLDGLGKDIIHIAATGSGKTLIIAMWMLLHPDKCVITISPLKELQRGQASGVDRSRTSRELMFN